MIGASGGREYHTKATVPIIRADHSQPVEEEAAGTETNNSPPDQGGSAMAEPVLTRWGVPVVFDVRVICVPRDLLRDSG